MAEKHSLPAPGDRAQPTENLTIDSTGVPPAAIDSRALDGAPVPDPDLHQTTIADALDQQRPILVLFSTPTYCVSLMCGPETDGLEALAQQYPDRAVFIHVEIWRNYNKSVVNQAANDWCVATPPASLTEPWLFLIGPDGVIKDRWGPLFDPDEVAKELAQLPARSPESSRRPDYHRSMSSDVPPADDRHEPPHEHRHEHFGTADSASLATAQGVRATWISLGILAVDRRWRS